MYMTSVNKVEEVELKERVLKVSKSSIYSMKMLVQKTSSSDYSL